MRCRPTPVIAERITLSLPGLPDAMQGKSVLHLCDLHVRRYRPWYRRMIDMCARERPDFVWLTGDYMTTHGDERVALRVLGDLLDALRPRIGIHACFGNHDTEAFKRMAMKLDKAVWLEQDACCLPEWGITLMGTSTPVDVLTTLVQAERRERDRPPALGRPYYRILLGHEPTVLISCAEFAIQWALLGHTHGGQFRLGLPFALHNSCQLPLGLSSGLLRCRDSIGTISRGLGESYLDIRLLCPPQMPLYLLRRGPLAGEHRRKMYCVKWW